MVAPVKIPPPEISGAGWALPTAPRKLWGGCSLASAGSTGAVSGGAEDCGVARSDACGDVPGLAPFGVAGLLTGKAVGIDGQWPVSPSEAALRELHQVIIGIHTHRDLASTAQAVADIVVAAVGFAVAAVSVVCPGGGLSIISVAGSDAAREQLLGTHRPLSAYEQEFAVAQRWGTLLFVPHERLPDAVTRGWIPDVAVSSDPDAWHRLDALYAPLRSSAGALIGVLSVDLPHAGRRPLPTQRDLLELFAVQAGIAIDNALLTAQLIAGEEIFREAFDGTAGGMALISLAGARPGRFLRVNAALCQIVDRTAEQLLSMSTAELTHPEDQADDRAIIEQLISRQLKLHRSDRRLLDPAGIPVWVTVTTTLARSADGSALCAVSQVEDISRHRTELAQLHHQARHDPLTQLPNRVMVDERLRQALTTAQDTARAGAVLFLDLDQFKLINDRYGHLVGDQVLMMLAPRMQSAVRRGDLVARVGGDEFVVIADQLEPGEAQELAQRIRAAVAAPITHKEAVITVTVSVGISPIPIDGADPTTILRSADHDMYEHKPADAPTGEPRPPKEQEPPGQRQY